jgi:phosphoglycerate dehydrogenase-like enzyme
MPPLCPLRILVAAWLPEGRFERLRSDLAGHDWLDGRDAAGLDRHLAAAEVLYGLPPLPRLAEAVNLKWVQLTSAGVPQELCPVARQRGLTVTNMAGLYGPTIAEHTFALVGVLARNFVPVFRNQQQGKWDRSVMQGVRDLHGRTLAVVGLGNIGRAVARLGRAYGMRVVGCRRTDARTPDVDHVYPRGQLRAMLAEADVVVVAAPLTAATGGMLGPEEFAALKPGALFVNVSRGAVADEAALLEALHSGRVAAAGLDAFAGEPLPPGHAFWTMPQVFVSPHVSGETVNFSAAPSERFRRNLAAWDAGRPLEGLVDLEHGY